MQTNIIQYPFYSNSYKILSVQLIWHLYPMMHIYATCTPLDDTDCWYVRHKIETKVYRDRPRTIWKIDYA